MAISVCIQEFVSLEFRTHLRNSLKEWPNEKIEICLTEFVKFAVLASQMESVFLPCSFEVDKVWHIFILETREYFSFCEKIKKGFYLHHHGISFEDHAREKSTDALIDDDLSVIASYIQNFGPFSAESIQHWPVAQHLVNSNFKSLGEFNSYFSRMLKLNERAYLQ